MKWRRRRYVIVVDQGVTPDEAQRFDAELRAFMARSTDSVPRPPRDRWLVLHGQRAAGGASVEEPGGAS